MNLRNRSLLSLGVTFLIFFIVIAVVSFSVTLSGIDRIESQHMARSINQTYSALHAESSSLLITTHDWAWWDDMAYFAVNRNPDFLQNNANNEAMRTLRIHLFIILDENGNILYDNILSTDFRSNSSVSPEIMAIIRNNPELWAHPGDDQGIAGLLLSPRGPIVLASAPILQSDLSGPARGTVIMGRFLEYGPLQRINEMTSFTVAFDWPGREGPAKLPPAVREQLEQGSAFSLAADNETVITGYSRDQDLTGRDLFLIVSMDRELHRIGLSNIYTYLVLLAFWAVLTGIIVAIVIDRMVLQRMGRLTDHVRSLSSDSHDIPSPVLTGDDELAELERTIITSRNELAIREQQLRIFVNAMPGPAALFSRNGTILLANPAFAEYLNKRPEEIVGSDLRTFVQPEDLERYNRFFRESIRNKKTVHFEHEAGGKFFYSSYYPVLGQAGEVIQLGLLAFDISERKRLENALQKVTKKIGLLNTVIFQDIQNKVFVQMGYLELARQLATDTRLRDYLEKEEVIVGEIQSSLQFAKQYNDMGISPPRWQNVLDVMLFAVSHIELGNITRDFRLEGLEIFADSLLERVFVTLIENTVMYAEEATVIRARYIVSDDDAVIIIEDNGPGIPADKKEEIFKKGIGAGGSTSLFLSREILSITGITIRETGVAGEGARFEIRIPKGSFRISGK